MDVFGVLEKTVAAAKKIREISQKLHDADLQNNIADLLTDAADLKIAVADQREENARLRTELEEIKAQIDLRTKLKFENGLYYLTETVPGRSKGPFCPRCWEERDKLMTLMDYWCNVCDRCYKSNSPHGPYISLI